MRSAVFLSNNFRGLSLNFAGLSDKSFLTLPVPSTSIKPAVPATSVTLRNLPEALWRALTAIDPERDIEFVHGPVDELDFAARLPCYGSKMGIDATRKWKEEGFQRRWPDEIVMSTEVRRRIDALWPELGIRLRR